ncbi:MAG TPA: hypothetical protein VI456_10745 [Polyangia bacterium]
MTRPSIRPAWRAIGRALAARRSTFLLLGVAAVPFLPCALDLLRHGLPDVLFTGDGAVLEIRTLHALHGRQLLGPYSRFLWSHPGPTFFYLAAPIYWLCGLRGAGIRLFVLGANFAAATALMFAARRLRGDLFAFVVGVLLAFYEAIGAPFPLWGEWNPMTPILPLALLFFLAARLGGGAVGVLPTVAFVASAIVQTHLGFVPVVLYLAATGALFCLRELTLVGVVADVDRRRVGRAVALAAVVLALVWALPVYENHTRHPGNLSQLRAFFMAPHRAEHSWRIVVDTVAGQLAIFPLSLARAFGRTAVEAGAAGRTVLAAAEISGLLAALGVALRRRDQSAALLAAMALGTIVVAAFSVRVIRGEIFDYLVAWISVLGLLACAAIATLFLRPAAGPPRRASLVVLLVGVPLLLLAVRFSGDPPMVRDRDARLETAVAEVTSFVRAARLDRPRLEIASHDKWPEAAALVLSLYKQRLGVTVADDWLFMFGDELRATPGPHPALVVADEADAAPLRARPDCRLVASAPGVFVFYRPEGRP